MRPTTLMRLALAGTHTDTVRVGLTGLSAALATLVLLVAATVLASPGLYDDWNGNAPQYRLDVLVQPGLRPGVVVALVLLTIPVLALAGQCARLGAPARDRRLAAIRLAGGTPRQVVRVAAAETGVASAFGAGAGLAAYLVGRKVAHRPDENGQLLLPTDQLPAGWAMVAICAGLPLLAAAVAAVLLRRVAFTPFGVVRRQRTRPPRPWPGLLIALGMALFLWPILAARRGGDGVPIAALIAGLFGGGMLAAIGVVLGAAWISYTVGRVLGRFARRPAGLLAGRRLVTDPWEGSRVLAALLVAALFGAGAAGIRAGFTTLVEVRAESQRQYDRAVGQESGTSGGDEFYLRAMDLVDAVVLVALTIAAAGLLVAVVEGIVSRRRTYASLVATGVPRSVLARSVLWRTLAPAVPAVGIALVVGAAMGHGFMPESEQDGGQACRNDQCVQLPDIARTAPVPFGDLAMVGGVALAAVLAMVGLGLLFLRASTDVTEVRTS